MASGKWGMGNGKWEMGLEMPYYRDREEIMCQCRAALVNDY